MPNYFLPGVGAYSNNTYFQNIVTWSTTSRTLRANFKLFTGFVCSYCSNLLQKDHINMQKVNFRPQATYTISLRYFLVLCVISAVLLSIINKFIVRERQKNKCSDTVYGTFQFHIAWPVDCKLYITRVLTQLNKQSETGVRSDCSKKKKHEKKWRATISQRPDIE